MSRTRFTVFSILVLALFPLLAAEAERPSEQAIRAILVDRIDGGRQSVGVVVGWIDENGRTVVGHGKRAADAKTPPDGDTVFEIGSVSKVFTAIALADMVREGKVALQDPVQKFLPEGVKVPLRGDDPITLYHLTTHTSGLPRMPDNFAPADPGNPYADYSVQQMYEFLSGHEPARGPGAEAEYSNLAVGLLGHVLAIRQGADYETLVRKRITGPLGMGDTSIALSADQRKRLARGHDANLKPVSNWDIPTLAGAGALRSTVHDMLKFVAANLGLVDTELSGALQTTHEAREELGSSDTKVGLGWIVTRKHGRTIHWHNGGTGGYHSFVGLDTKRRRGVVVLSNASPSIDDIGLHLLEPKFALANPKPPTTTAGIPDSPVGKALKGWLKATGGADVDAEQAREHYETAFDDSFKSAVPLEAYMGFRGQLRGMLQGAAVGKVVVRGDHDLTAHVEAGAQWLEIHVQVTPDTPHRIVGLLVKPSAPPE